MGNNLFQFLMTSRGVKNLLSRAYSLIQRFGLGPGKMESSLTCWAKIAHKYNIRATFPVTAIIVKRYPRVIKRLQAQGIEFALHGFTHIDYSVLSLAEQITHFNKAIKVFNFYGIDFDGFRAPYTRWNHWTMEAIQELKIKWESSKTMLWDIFFTPLNVQSKGIKAYEKAVALYNSVDVRTHPVLPDLSYGEVQPQFVEIPLCLPDDEMLVDRLKLPLAKIKEIWEYILAQSYERGELFTLQLHPERLPLCKSVIEQVIRKAQSYYPKVWIASLNEIAEWWNEKAQFRAEVKDLGRGSTSNSEYKIIFNCSARATILCKNIECPSLQAEKRFNLKWNNSYQWVKPGTNEVIVKANIPPVIVKDTVDKTDESTPTIWFWRWPNGARSCLSITGDVDSLTLVDFLLRIVGK